MAQDTSKPTEPRGFGEHSRGLAGEYAHEQGWGLNEEERTHQSSGPQDIDGGNDYEYGAQDFGDEPVNVAIDRNDATPELTNNQDAKPNGEPVKQEGNL